MRITGTVPLTSAEQLAEMLAEMRREIAELQRSAASAPTGAARGQVAYAQDIDGQGSITAEADLTGLAVTLTTVAGRRYKITGSVRVGSTTAADRMIMRIKEGATTLQTAETDGSTAKSLERTIPLSPSAGSHTYKLTLERIGAGTGSMTSSSTAPAFILVEDIGPA